MAEAIARSADNDDAELVGVVEESSGNSKMPPPAPKKTPVDCGTAADDDVTPANLVSVRSYLSKKRRENRKSMSKEERKRHATVLNGLSSRPKNQTYVKELNEINDLPTPERAEELLALAEDMEEN